jgi:hypothetical protein
MKKIVGFLLLTLITVVAAQATTLWGVAGENIVNGGTLVAKNFDYSPKYGTKLQFVTPQIGYRYLADILYGPGTNPSVQSGINEKGLVVTGAGTQLNKPTSGEAKLGFNEWVLNSYGSVDDFLADKEQAVIYPAGVYLIADSVKLALIELSTRGEINVQEVTTGPICYSKNKVASSRSPRTL